MKPVILAFFCLSTLGAALPPLYETLAEYKALIESPLLTENLNSADAIEKIIREDQKFTVITNKSVLELDIVYEKTKMIGPQKFHFNFYSKKLREKTD